MWGKEVLKIGGEKFRDKLTAVWFELLDLGAKCNCDGFLISNEIAYKEFEDIAIMLDREPDEIELCMKFYISNNMIEVIDDCYKLSNWEKYQNVDGLEKIRENARIRVARCREKKKLKLIGKVCQYCGQTATGYDHILAITKGGNSDQENLVECCIECNRIKNDKPLVDFLNNNLKRIKPEIVMRNENLNKLVYYDNETKRFCNVTECYNVTLPSQRINNISYSYSNIYNNINDINSNINYNNTKYNNNINNSNSNDNKEDNNDIITKKPNKTDKKENIVKDIIEYLNLKANKKFKATNKETVRHINARISEGFTFEDFKIVIDKKVDEWKNTTMDEYIRPLTLFGTKFESYLNSNTTNKEVNRKKPNFNNVVEDETFI